MLLLSWPLLVTPIQREQIFDVFMSAFLAQGRETSEELSAYFNKEISPRLKKGELIYAAFDDDRIIGFIIFEKGEGQSYYVAETAILPEYQRRGIGKQLVFAIFDKDPTAEKLVLMTEKANSWAQSFYEKIGFNRSSIRLPNYPENCVGYEFSIER